MAVLETHYRDGMTRDEAVKLCADAIEAGIWNDLGSGSNVDVCVMEKGKDAELYRNYLTPNKRGEKERSYKFARGTTLVLLQKVRDLCQVEEEIVEFNRMDVDVEA